MRMVDRELLDSSISRREFLQYILGIILVVFGVTNFINSIMRIGRSPTKVDAPANTAHGFGASKFGK